MPMEHYRRFGTRLGLVQGYFCLTCGGKTAMISPLHGPGVCDPNPDLVKELVTINSREYQKEIQYD